MKPQPMALWACLCLMAPAVYGQAPGLSYAVPSAVAPGDTVEVTLHGSNLDGVTGMWTSFPASTEFVPEGSEAGKAIYRIAVPPDVSVGIGGVRLATGRGISNLRLFMIDDLPTVSDNGANKTAETAQELTLPVAVDGACEAESYDFYQFTAVAGQRVTMEVVARRLGSPLDPVVRLLDAGGRELAYSDDEGGIGADCRFAFQIPDDGIYLVEVRDIRYQGGAGHRYRLRIGNFPLATVPFPLGGRKHTAQKIELVGPAVEGVPRSDVNIPQDAAGDRVWVSAKNEDGQGSAFAVLVAGDLAEAVEFEPNSAPEQALPVALPCAINGRFDAAKDRDFYQFDAKKDQRFVFVGLTRSLGSPSDLFIQLYKADGTKVAEAEDAGTSEGILNYKFAEDGTYRLMVEDLHRRGGPQYAYRVEVRPHRAGFSLALESDKFDVPQGGVFVAKVTCGRREYDGPITLSLDGVPDGFALVNNVIPEKKNETVMRVTAPASLEPGKWFVMNVVGRAKIGESDYVARAGTLGKLRELFAGLPYPPEELNSSVGLGVGPAFPDFFKLSLDSEAVRFPQLVGASAFKVKAEKLNKFDDKIDLAVEGLPPGVTAEVKPIEKGQGEVEIALKGPAALAEGDHPFRIVGSATFQNQPKRVVIDDALLRVIPPLEVALAPAGPITAGGTQKIKFQLTRYGEEKPPVTLELRNLPAGVTAPENLTVAEGQSEAEVELTAAADAAVGAAERLVVVASTTLKGRTIQVQSLPATLEVAAP